MTNFYSEELKIKNSNSKLKILCPQGNTAMHYAVSHGNFDVVSVLLDSKVCNVDVMNTAGYTSVMLVSLAQIRTETHRHVVRRLFHLSDVNTRAKQVSPFLLLIRRAEARAAQRGRAATST